MDNNRPVRDDGDSSASSSQKTHFKDKRSCAFGIIFAVVYIGLLFGSMFLFGFGFYVAGGIAFGCSCLMIILSLVISKLIDFSRKRKEQKELESYRSFIASIPDDNELREVSKIISCTPITSPDASSPPPEIKVYRLILEKDGNRYEKIVGKPYPPDDFIPTRINIETGFVKLLDKHSLSSPASYQSRLDSIAYAIEHPPARAVPRADGGRYSPVKPYAPALSHITDDDSPSTLSSMPLSSESNQSQSNASSKHISENPTPDTPLRTQDDARRTPRPNVGYKGIKRKKP